MDTRENMNDGDVFFDADAKPFRMLALYDSAETSLETKRASAVFLRELGDDIAVDTSAWDIHTLSANDLRNQSATEAARADVILIALSDEQPNKVLKEWADAWQCSRELTNGLLALIPSGKNQSGGLLAEFLYETAVTANMDFLCRKKRRF